MRRSSALIPLKGMVTWYCTWPTLVDTVRFQSLRSPRTKRCQLWRSAVVSLMPVDDRHDLSDPDLLADHLPLDEFAWLRRNEPVRWNPQTTAGAYGDGGV